MNKVGTGRYARYAQQQFVRYRKAFYAGLLHAFYHTQYKAPRLASQLQIIRYSTNLFNNCMDHLPRADGSTLTYSEVPYLRDFTYDNAGFTTFPSRAGFDKKRLLAGDFTQHSENDTNAFLQAWLFFGMMSEVMDEHVRPEDFVRTASQGHQVVTTRDNLTRYVRRWLERLRKKLVADAETRIADCLQEVSNYSTHLSGGHLGPTSCPLPLTVSLSIMVLGASLEAALSQKSDVVGFRVHKKRWGHSPLLTNRLLELNWCINDVARLSEIGSIHLTCFASTVQRSLRPGITHGNCTTESCVAHQIPEGRYPTMHSRSDCQCDHVSVPLEKVTAILANSGIPVVSIQLVDGQESPILDVVCYHARLDYCAISHVWSDGLGNTDANSLPICQLRRLYSLVTPLASSSSFSCLSRAEHMHIEYSQDMD